VSSIEVLATGDAIVAHRVSLNPDPDFVRLVDLVRSTDVSIANVEMVFPGEQRRPSTTMHGIPLGVDPDLLGELQWFGFDMYGMANNHATDYGTDGLVASLEHLDHRRMAYAGAGRTLRLARAPRYMDTAGGRVAFIAAGSSNSRLALAADCGVEDLGRPGIAPIRLRRTHYVDPTRLAELQDILTEVGVDVSARSTTAPGIHFPYPDKNIYDSPLPGGFAVDSVHFAPSDEPRIQTDALEADVDALLSVVHEASRQADLVIVALHCHEGRQGRWNSDAPAEFLQPLAHRLIDGGAHAVVGHGPHMLRGVEIYNGRPICYSLGNFIFNLEVMSAFPMEVYQQQGMPANSSAADLFDRVTGYRDEPRFWESVAVKFSFEDGRLKESELWPVTLGRDEQRSRRGCPRMASQEDGARILERLDELSRPLGGTVQIQRLDGRAIGRL
jgi:poly-gamma-glutamate capsule biosynthesis protein CapA/YwtB (metallophosphatase superfamily)